MKKALVALTMFLVLVLGVVASCDHKTNMTQEDPWASFSCESQCDLQSQEGCSATEYCVEVRAYTEACKGVVITRCDQGCRVFSDKNGNKTGDSCGDGWVCNIQSHQCEATGETTNNPDNNGNNNGNNNSKVVTTEVQCCYANPEIKSAEYFGQFAWSKSSVADPEAWGAARDLEVDNVSCFVADVDLTGQFGCLFTDITRGKAELGHWAGASWRPTHCYVSGAEVSVGQFVNNRGWSFYCK